MPVFTTVREGESIAVLEEDQLWAMVQDYLSYLTEHNQVKISIPG
jgi:hypothetical protein